MIATLLCLFLPCSWSSPSVGFGLMYRVPSFHVLVAVFFSFLARFAIRLVRVLHPSPLVRIAYLYHHPTTLGPRNTCSPQHRAFGMRPFPLFLFSDSCSFSMFQYCLYCRIQNYLFSQTRRRFLMVTRTLLLPTSEFGLRRSIICRCIQWRVPVHFEGGSVEKYVFQGVRRGLFDLYASSD